MHVAFFALVWMKINTQPNVRTPVNINLITPFHVTFYQLKSKPFILSLYIYTYTYIYIDK